MKVWILQKRHPGYALVDDSLEIYDYDSGEIVGVFNSEYHAMERRDDLQHEADLEKQLYDCDETEYFITEWNVEEEFNTELHYLYRDASNYRWNYKAVVRGRVTDAQKAAIFQKLQSDGDIHYFLPDAVGLPCDYAAGCEYDTELDHPYCEIRKDDISLTKNPPTVNIDADGLFELFMMMPAFDVERFIR